MSGYFCTSTVTRPMAFLLVANISTTDIYTTLSNIQIEHDQMTVAWQEADLKNLPKEIAMRYASIMGITITTSSDVVTSKTESPAGGASGMVATQTSTATVAKSKSRKPTTTTKYGYGPSPTPSNDGHRISRRLITTLVG